MSGKIIKSFFIELVTWIFVASSFCKQLSEECVQNNTLLNVRVGRLLFGEINVQEETKNSSLKGRIVSILEKDDNEFSKHLNTLIRDEDFRNKLKSLTHDDNAQNVLNSLMRCDSAEKVDKFESFEENIQNSLNSLKSLDGKDSIFGDLEFCNSNESIDKIAKDNDSISELDIIKHEKKIIKADAMKKERQLDNLKYNYKQNIYGKSENRGLLKKIDKIIERDILKLMQSNCDDNANDCIKPLVSFSELLSDLKKYRIFVPLFILAGIAILLTPPLLFANLTGATIAYPFFYFIIYNGSLFSSFALGLYYQLKFKKCNKIIKKLKKIK
ncbi:Pv-fam-d protein [Plasmodium gonderi]|uniref:Pv-fam-d protein n=1 Tax=Plasmodium gonderi TaxID=77519 RepID=A0A1Y1JUF7_PLAGO|nr:Pv-fam-d protein [Plasmodium gonderi]GAW84727.1 Pv-fam-d protein [Plasmodium gonderi]